jgi:hypothetical protein
MEHEIEPGRAGQPEPGAQSSPDGPGLPGPGASAASGRGPGAVPGTGEPRVDAALKLLDRLPGLPVSEHPELFEQVHAQLTEVLGELDSGPAGPAGQHANEGIPLPRSESTLPSPSSRSLASPSMCLVALASWPARWPHSAA